MKALKALAEKFNLAKRDAVFAAIILLAIAGFLFDSFFATHALFGILLVADGFALGLLLLAIAVIAGFTIMEALLEIAAGLSLLIFLAQAYCAAPGHTSSSDAALKSLLTLGLLYVLYYFFRTLYNSLATNLVKFREQKKSWKRTLFIVFYLIFTASFVWEIYLFMGPIVRGLCVFN